jgi:hypothetical protein
MKKFSFFLAICLCMFVLGGCDESSDQKQATQQELLNQEATSQTGMPNIKNFRERKLLKEIYEMRDQSSLVTYTYFVAEMTGKLVFLGESIGYGIPYATQYTNPQKVNWQIGHSHALPQADPNGLYSPSNADGTWVLLKDPNSGKVLPVFIEPRIVVSPFKLRTE